MLPELRQHLVLLVILLASVSWLGIHGVEDQTTLTTRESNSIPLSRYLPTAVFQETWGGSGFDRANGVASDSSGNIYITGTTFSFCCGYDIFLLKLNSTGSLIWQRIWGGNQTYIYLHSGANALALDSSGKIYVTGYTNYNSTQGQVVVLLKFDSNGNLLWQRGWGWLLGQRNPEWGEGVALDSSGGIYVTGTTYSYGIDFFLLKFSSNGSLLWQKIWGGSPSASYFGTGVAAESSGIIYLAGTAHFYSGFSPQNSSAVLLKFNSAGTLEWQKMWGGNATDMEGANAVSLDASGNVYVTGSSHDNRNGSSTNGIPIAKFDSDGTVLWQRMWLGSGYASDAIGTGLTVNSSGNIVLTGSASSSGPRNCSIIMLGFSPSGDSQWQTSAGASNSDRSAAISSDSSGNSLVAGSVIEGPPYSLDPLNYPVITRNYTVATLAGGLTTYPGYSLVPINGTLLVAYGSQTYSGQSDAYILKVQPPEPSPSSPPVALAAVAGNGNITLSWNPPEYSGGYAVTGYHIYKATTSGSETLFANITNSRSYTDLAVKSGVIYYYFVKAVNLLGESDASNENHASIGAGSGFATDRSFSSECQDCLLD